MKKGSEKTPDEETPVDNPPDSREQTKSGKENDNFAIGSRLEACDARGNWYAAKVENIRWDSSEVFIHFDGWSTKYNEWISMKSERLRSVQKPAPKKPPEKFAIGEKVLALWSAYHKSQATVQKFLPDGKYQVLFHDGYVKRVLPSRMWHLNESSKSSMPDIGSKQDRRNRKRKHVVADLFRSNKRPRTASEEKKAAASSPTVDEPTPSTSSPSPGPPEKSPPKIKQPLDSPKPFDVTYLDGHKETWSKFTTRRTEGKTAGKLEIVISTPTGRRFRARSEVSRYCEDNKIQFEPKLFDFSAKGRKEKKKSESVEEQIEAPLDVPVVEPEPVVLPPAPAPPPPPSFAPIVPPPVPEVKEEKLFIGSLEVVVEDGQYICPVTECRKHFRKENLLHMHTKHYHPELSKFLDYTPSVTDLAYARTVSILEQDNSPLLKSAVRPDLRSADVKRSPNRNCDSKLDLKSETETMPEQDSNQTNTSLSSHDSTSVKTEAAQSTTGDGDTEMQSAEPSAEASVASNTLPRPPKPHWKRRPYHRSQLAAADWYGRMGKQPVVRPSNEPTGKQTTQPVGTIVQRNPILNTLLSSRPLAPVMSWRSNWRRKRRRGWRRRILRVPPPPRPKPDHVDGLEDSKVLPTADGSVDGTGTADDVKYDKLKGNEIINCSCTIKEEDGLMIQCDVCLCWQHGHCQGIDPQSDVSESYVCSVCKDPTRGRSSRKYYNHQDWMKQGILPRLPFPPNQPSQKRILLKRAFEVSGQLSLLSRLLHSLRVKLSIASNKNHPKLWLWAKKWQEDEKSVITQPAIKEEKSSLPKAPEPEKPIDPIECKLNLLDHILHYQDLVETRLDSLELVVTELEAMNGDAEEPEKVARISATMKMILRDLDTVKKLAMLP